MPILFMTNLVTLICPACRSKLSNLQTHYRCENCREVYEVKENIPVLLPSSLDEFSLEEADYHTDFSEDPIEVHQLNTIRNEYYHDLLRKDVISGEPELVLEVGGGTGQDATAILDAGINLVETDISLGALIRGRQKIEANSQNKNIQFVCCTLTSLPFPDQSFDACFAVAMIHHLKNIDEGMLEMSRVTTEGGRIILGIEPNATYFRQIKRFRKILCSLSHTDQQKASKADAEMSGFTERELRDAFAKARISISEIIPVWLTLGYFHYAQEFLFRAFRLKKRVRLPKGFEKLLLMFDRAIFNLPLTKYFCWHWIITGVKR
jgi:ubiquinone/menaquinone biosynthesis C-methylase UbiE/uncharacterized protein YbaR (Trm112 family)